MIIGFIILGVSAIYGLPGRGKSHFALFYSIFLANRYEKKLIFTFYINPLKLAKYCQLMGYEWLCKNFNNNIYYISLDNPTDILAIPDSVIFADEIGNELPSMDTWKSNNRKEFLRALRQVRHESQYLLVTGQHEKQIDAQIRYLVEEVFHCNGISNYNKVMKNECLINKRVRRFTPENYEQWMSNPKIRKNPLKTRLVSNKSWIGIVSAADSYIFNIYDSFTRLEYQERQKYQGLNYREIEIIGRDGEEEITVEVIQGNFPYKDHNHQKVINWLFTHLPANFKERIIKWDEKLAKIKKLNKIEKFIIKSCMIFIGFHLVRSIL